MLPWRLIIQGDTHLSLDDSGAANARLLANPSGSGLMLVSFMNCINVAKSIFAGFQCTPPGALREEWQTKIC